MERIEFTLPGMLPKLETDGVEPALPPANALVQNRIEHQPLPARTWRSTLRLDQPSPFEPRIPMGGFKSADAAGLDALRNRSRSLPASQQEQVARMLDTIARFQQERLAVDARSFAERRW